MEDLPGGEPQCPKEDHVPIKDEKAGDLSADVVSGDVWEWVLPGTVLWRARSTLELLSKDSVRATVDHEEYGVKSHPREEVMQHIEGIWDARFAANPRIFNGSKFRLADVKYGANNKEEKTLKLCIGLTNYKSFLGTNCTPDDSFYARLLDDGKCLLGVERGFIADPLGVGSITLTKDNKFLVLERSHNTSEYQGYIDPPAGHAEPARAGWDIAADVQPDKPEFESAFMKELFFSIKDEIVQEVNLPIESLSEPLLCAVIRQVGPSRSRPNAVFLVRCNLSEAQVRELYERGGTEKDESVALHALSRDDLVLAREEGNVNGAPLTPQTRVCISLLLSGVFES